MSCLRSLMLVNCFVATCLLCGCPKPATHELGKEADVDHTTEAELHHHDHGPHGGHIVELGAYHGEVTMSPERVVTLYILAEDAKTPVVLANATAALHVHAGDKETEVAMTAAPQEGETDGKTSVFTASGLPESIHDIEELKGEVLLTVSGKTSTGELSHDHDHDHGHEHAEQGK